MEAVSSRIGQSVKQVPIMKCMIYTWPQVVKTELSSLTNLRILSNHGVDTLKKHNIPQKTVLYAKYVT